MADAQDEQTLEITGNVAPRSSIHEPRAPGGKLLGRAAAARLLGVSKTTLRRMEGDAIEPVVGPKNERLFHEEQVQALVMTRRTSMHDARPTGDVAADAFTLFDEQVHPVDVIKQLRLAPDLVESLHQQWARLRDSLVLSPETTTAICSMLREGDPGALPKNDAELLELAKQWVYESSPHVCFQCKRESAQFCRACAKAWGLLSARNDALRRRTERL